MKSGGRGTPTAALADKIKNKFGSFDKFKEEFQTPVGIQFGFPSGGATYNILGIIRG